MSDRGEARGKTVLVIEDNALLREMIRELLESEGYQVLEAGGADEAFSVSRSHPRTIHLALTDVVQPKMSGPELADQLLKARPGLRVLFMSGYLQESSEARGEPPTMAPFIEKPFTTSALLAKIRQVIGEPPDDP